MISDKIILVDDDERVHQSLKTILFDYQIISFVNPQKALDFLLGPHEVHLALVDICMQGLSGIELLEKIKRVKKDIAIMIITAHGNQDIIVEAMRLHADDYLEKPFNVPELRERVKLILKEKYRFAFNARDPKALTQRIRYFIERNYTNATLDYIAKEMNISTHYLSRLFVKYNRQGFRGYRLQVRMEKAAELLSQTSLDVSEIAYQLGYENPESFMRAFKGYFKKTPGDYRMKAQKLGGKA